MGTRSVKSIWLVPPGLADWQKRALKDIQARAPQIDNLVWALSSGTQSVDRVKCIALERAGLRTSALAVNHHLGATSRDRWLIALPEYHVGGFMISVRAELSKSRLFRMKRWSAAGFHAHVKENKISLSALVPTQIYDLVDARLTSPPGLRAIVVGGGRVAPELYRAARALNWPVLPSYGLTETGSQVATASLSSLKEKTYPDLQILDHAEIALEKRRIFIRAESACRFIAVSDGVTFTLEDPRIGGWIETADLGQKTKTGLRILGRSDDIVKVLGQLVSLPQIEGDLVKHFGPCAVLALPDARRGRRLVAVTDADRPATALNHELEIYNRLAQGPWRLDQVVWVPKLPRTALGKLKKSELALRLNL